MPIHEWLWTTGSPQPPPIGNDVVVCGVDLDMAGTSVNDLSQLLSEEELQRADRFRFTSGRNHFIVCRAALRRLLGMAVNLNPAALVFRYTPRGKPELAGAAFGALHFNVSHSDGLALIAMASSATVGVDVELIRTQKYRSDIALRFFTARESAGLQTLSETLRDEAFFNLWTRKEAWLKATGDGIADSLSRVEVSFLPGEPARVVDVADNPGEALRWTLMDLRPAQGFAAAVAVRAENVNVRFLRFTI